MLYGLSGLVCAAGLSVVGIGWHAEHRAQRTVPERVFVDIEALGRSHPAWNQVVETRRLISGRRQVSDSESGGAAVESVPLPDRAPVAGSDSRAVLEARLEQRAQDELTTIGEQLNTSLAGRLREKRRELDAQAEAGEADARRRSEQELARNLRALDEERRFEQVSAGIKLVALEAQVSAPGVNADRVKAAIEANRTQIANAASRLASDEDDLSKKIEAELTSAREQRRNATEQELAGLQDQASRRIADLIQRRRERLRQELDGNGLAAAGGVSAPRSEAVAAGSRSSNRTAKIRSAARLAFARPAAASGGSLAAFEQTLRARVKAELEAETRRIARYHGFSVTFQPEEGARNRTEWFRERLPYVTVGKAS